MVAEQPGRGRAPRAVLWDLDGTLVDSEEAHFRAWRSAARRRGIELTRERFRELFGLRNDVTIPRLFGVRSAAAVAQIEGEKETEYRMSVRAGGARLLPGAADWLATFRRWGWPQAIVSSAPRENIETVLAALGIANAFGAIVGAEDVAAGKPNPECMLLAATRLGIEPARCTVVEDAPAGVEAARRVGMRTVGVLTTHDALDADLVVRSLRDIDPKDLLLEPSISPAPRLGAGVLQYPSAIGLGISDVNGADPPREEGTRIVDDRRSDWAPVLWKRLDLPGYESCRIRACDEGWRVDGTAVLARDASACRLDYVVTCDHAWTTRSAVVRGWVGDRDIDVTVTRDGSGRWLLNGAPSTEVDGCADVDLNFSPSTNLLPIRRLELAIGQSAGVRAAWLRFPSFTLEPLEQTYARLAERRYRYESGGGRFVAELEVDGQGLVLDYGGLWAREVGE